MPDLFGHEQAPLSPKNKSGKRLLVRGYAAAPGGGPEGETCRSCASAVKANTGTAKGGYWKCLKQRHRWTSGPGSDIRLKSPACKHWERKPLEVSK